MIGGAIPSGISAAATSDERSEIRERFVRFDVDPGLVVAQEWERELKAQQFYPVVAGAGDAEFRIDVATAGLTGSGRTFYPQFYGTAKLVRRDGVVLWEARTDADGVNAKRVMAGNSYEEYMRDPAVFRESFTKAAQLFSRDFLAYFKDEYRASLEDDIDQRRDEEDREWAKLPKAERIKREQLRKAEDRQRELEQKAEERARVQAEKQERLQAKADQRRFEQERRARR